MDLTRQEKLDRLENLLGPPRGFCNNDGRTTKTDSYRSLTVTGLFTACQMVMERFIAAAGGIARLGVNTLFADTIFAENIVAENTLCVPSGTTLPEVPPPTGCLFFLIPGEGCCSPQEEDFDCCTGLPRIQQAVLYASTGLAWVPIG